MKHITGRPTSVLQALRMNSHTEMTCRKFLFTALHCMQRGLGDRKAVCLSVCLSVKRVNCDKTKETSAHILISWKVDASSFRWSGWLFFIGFRRDILEHWLTNVVTVATIISSMSACADLDDPKLGRRYLWGVCCLKFPVVFPVHSRLQCHHLQNCR